MKLLIKKVIGLVFFTTAVTGFASIATYSGVYNLNTGVPTLVAITKGGFLLSLSNNTTFREELTPAKSTVNSTGKVVGSTQSGVSVTAQIASDFTVTGTAKLGGSTQRITGRRILK